MKELKELTLKEYTDLKRSGLMWVVFPEATGEFVDDCEAELKALSNEELAEKYIQDSEPNELVHAPVNDLIRRAFIAGRKCSTFPLWGSDE